MQKYLNKFRISSTRLPGYDYGSNGLYYVTICTNNKIHYFGEINSVQQQSNSVDLQVKMNHIFDEVNPNEMVTFSPLGQIAFDFWKQIPEHYPFVELDTFVIMPNHIHGIVYLHRPDKISFERHKFGPQAKNLPAIIRAFKSSVKRESNIKGLSFAWQSRYYEKVITDEVSLNHIRDYIKMNPIRWASRCDDSS